MFLIVLKDNVLKLLKKLFMFLVDCFFFVLFFILSKKVRIDLVIMFNKKLFFIFWINSMIVIINVNSVLIINGFDKFLSVIKVFLFGIISFFFCKLINVKNKLILIVIVFFSECGIEEIILVDSCEKVNVIKRKLDIIIVNNFFC